MGVRMGGSGEGKERGMGEAEDGWRREGRGGGAGRIRLKKASTEGGCVGSPPEFCRPVMSRCVTRVIKVPRVSYVKADLFKIVCMLVC